MFCFFSKKKKGENRKMNEDKHENLRTMAMVNNYAIMELSERVTKLEEILTQMIKEAKEHKLKYMDDYK